MRFTLHADEQSVKTAIEARLFGGLHWVFIAKRCFQIGSVFAAQCIEHCVQTFPFPVAMTHDLCIRIADAVPVILALLGRNTLKAQRLERFHSISQRNPDASHLAVNFAQRASRR